MSNKEKISVLVIAIVGVAAIAAGCFAMAHFATQKPWGMATRTLAVAGTAGFITAVTLAAMASAIRYLDRRSR